MKHTLYGLLCLCIVLVASTSTYAQGPPITSDKPIMLSSKTMLIKSLTEIRKTESSTFFYAPIMYHYVFKHNFLTAIHVPLVGRYRPSDGLYTNHTGLGDIKLMAKYQFFRKDMTRRTLRMVIKGVQTFPTGKDLGVVDFGVGEFQTHLGWVTGYETIKHGISHELSYHFVPNHSDEIRQKFGIGLPLLKPLYPVNQLNLYFEYSGNYFLEHKSYELLYAQGIQYAYRHFTFEAAIQVPLVHTGGHAHHDDDKHQYSVFLGTRYVF